MGEATKYSIWVDNIVELLTKENIEKQRKILQDLFGKNIGGRYTLIGLEIAPTNPDLVDKIKKMFDISESYFKSKVEEVETRNNHTNFTVCYAFTDGTKICPEALRRLDFIEKSRIEHYTNFSSLGDCLKVIAAERIATFFRGKDYSIKIFTTG